MFDRSASMYLTECNTNAIDTLPKDVQMRPFLNKNDVYEVLWENSDWESLDHLWIDSIGAFNGACCNL